MTRLTTLARLSAAGAVAAASLGIAYAPPASAATGVGFHVVGNHILSPSDQVFVPYGFVVYCLSEKDTTCNSATTSKDALPDTQKIKAAAQFWHANTIRIQVAEENVFPHGSSSSPNSTFMSALESDVQLVNSLGMVAIVTQQEEYYNEPGLPTTDSLPFWNLMARTFGSNPNVFFDLYNEPRLGAPSGGGGGSVHDQQWNLWRNGGTATEHGQSYQFVGMQKCVDEIRSTGAQNIVVAEGLKADKDLSGIPQYALTGANIAYGMEPDLKSNDATPAQWAANWGNLSDSVPIMMEAFQDWSGSGACNIHSPTILPQLLAYLKSKQLGLIVWTLNPGVLIVGDNLQQPTAYTTAFQPCPANGGKKATAEANAELPTNTQGPGQVILAYFTANSHPAAVPGSAPLSPPAQAPQPAQVAPATRGSSGLGAGAWGAIGGGAAAVVAVAAGLALRRRGRRRHRR